MLLGPEAYSIFRALFKKECKVVNTIVGMEWILDQHEFELHRSTYI